MSQRFQFTRHAMSCNNISMGKSSGKDTEPSISLYGILNTISFSNKPENLEAFTSPHVYVSNLLRTWITAVLLYGGNTGKNLLNFKNPLNLYVYPWLKENKATVPIVGTTVERGNYPKDFQHTLKKFQFFFDELRNICNEIGNEIGSKRKMYGDFITGPGTPTKQYTKLGRWTNITGKDSKYKIGDPSPPNPFIASTEGNAPYKIWYESLPPTINLIIPRDLNDGGMQTVTFTRNQHGYYSYAANQLLTDTVGPKSLEKGFTEDANLVTFMKLCYGDTYKYNNGNPFTYNNSTFGGTSIVHVVTHSNAMQGFLKSKGLNIKEISEYKKKRLKQSNTWRFSVDYTSSTEQAVLVDKSIIVGVPGVDYIRDRATKLETAIGNHSLCGKPGSVARRTKNGGKRRRTIKRTKTRKNRKNKKSRKY